MFRSTQNKGFQITFENGWTISVQFGTGHYCDRRDLNAEYGNEEYMSTVKSPNAEIAIWDKNGEWYNFGSDEVKGYCTPDEVAEWIDKVSKW